MRTYCVYDMTNNEQFVMSGTAKQVSRKLKTSSKKVRDYCKKHYLIHRRYKIIEENYKGDLCNGSD